MATAGYLIARAAEQPPILALTTAIVAVRFFGLARPLARYLERLASHDVALRALAHVRTRVYERIEPLAPARLDAYADGDLLARAVADVDSLEDLHPRVLVPPLVAAGAPRWRSASPRRCCPPRPPCSRAACSPAASPSRCSPTACRRATAGRHAAARAELSTELVELLAARPSSSSTAPARPRCSRVRAADRALVAVARRDALAGGLADGLGVAVTGATVTGVLALAVADLDRVLVAMLALLALASFEAVQPLAAAARELRRVCGRASGSSSCSTASRRSSIRPGPAPPPAGADPRSRSRTCERAAVLDGLTPRGSTPGAGSRWSAPAAPARRRSSTCFCASSTRRPAA